MELIVCMGCLVKFCLFPFYLIYYSIVFSFYFFCFLVECFVCLYKCILSLFGVSFESYNKRSNKKSGNKKKRNKVIDVSWEEKEFNKEADLWGLSKEDRRIAKEERMSPADYIEAEERDDDELVTDEWESK